MSAVGSIRATPWIVASKRRASIQLDHEKTWLASQNEWFYSSILTLDVEG